MFCVWLVFKTAHKSTAFFPKSILKSYKSILKSYKSAFLWEKGWIRGLAPGHFASYTGAEWCLLSL